MEGSSDTAAPSGPEVMGHLLRSVAELPREPSTDILITQAFLQADARALQSREFRAGLSACLAGLRQPIDEEARAVDAAQWGMLLTDPLGEQLLFSAQLTPEQRRANLSFFLLRPELPLGLLAPAAGNLTSVAAHEAQLALQAFPPEQVAPVARISAPVAARFRELAELPPPVDAQTLAALVPEALSPERAASMLGSLADEVFGATLEDSPVGAQRRALSSVAAEGIRALAERLKTETEPRVVAQLFVLGGLQHQAFFQNLAPFTEDALAQHEQPLGTVSALGGVARELSATSVGLIGMALGGPVGTAAARVIHRKVSQAADALCAGGRLPLGALAGEVLGIPGLGPDPRALGEVIAALTQLYTAQLAELGDEAASLLEELLPLLFQGEVEGLGAGWAAQLGHPERVEQFQSLDAEARAQVARVLFVGGAVGAFSWEAVAPVLQAQGQALLGYALPPETPAEEVAGLHAASAAWAVAVLANEDLFQSVSAETLGHEEALEQARGLGLSLFAGGTEPASLPLAAAMLRVLTPPVSAEAEEFEDATEFEENEE